MIYSFNMNITPWTDFITNSSYEHVPITLKNGRSVILKQFYLWSFLPNTATLSPYLINSRASLCYKKNDRVLPTLQRFSERCTELLRLLIKHSIRNICILNSWSMISAALGWLVSLIDPLCLGKPLSVKLQTRLWSSPSILILCNFLQFHTLPLTNQPSCFHCTQNIKKLKKPNTCKSGMGIW